MKQKLDYQWFFSRQDGVAIKLHHPNMYLWIGMGDGGVTQGVRTVGIYDTRNLDAMDELGYVVIYSEKDKNHYGEVRPLYRNAEGVFDEPSSKFRWMTLEDKERMLDLMRQALSYRGKPIPPEFKPIWDAAHKIVAELDIINPGQKRYEEDSNQDGACFVTCPICFERYWSEDGHPGGTSCLVFG